MGRDMRGCLYAGTAVGIFPHAGGAGMVFPLILPCLTGNVLPVLGHGNFRHLLEAPVDGLPIHLQNLAAALSITLFRSLIHP